MSGLLLPFWYGDSHCLVLKDIRQYVAGRLTSTLAQLADLMVAQPLPDTVNQASAAAQAAVSTLQVADDMLDQSLAVRQEHIGIDQGRPLRQARINNSPRRGLEVPKLSLRARCAHQVAARH